MLRLIAEYDRQRFRKSDIAVKMIECEPAAFCLIRKRRERFVDSRPLRAEIFETGRFFRSDRFSQVVSAHVTDIVRKIEIRFGQIVFEQHPSDLSDDEFFCFAVVGTAVR